NAFIEASQVGLLKGKPTQTTLPSASGKGQVFLALCRLWRDRVEQLPSVWSEGTLDDRSRAPPGIHIYTSTKQPWVILRTAFLQSQNSTGQPIIGRPRTQRDSKQREQPQDRLSRSWPKADIPLTPPTLGFF